MAHACSGKPFDARSSDQVRLAGAVRANQRQPVHASESRLGRMRVRMDGYDPAVSRRFSQSAKLAHRFRMSAKPMLWMAAAPIATFR